MGVRRRHPGQPERHLGHFIRYINAVCAGVATLPAGGGAIAAGGFTVLNGVATTYAADQSGRADMADMPLGADTVEGILDKMADALQRAYQELGTGNSILANDVLWRIADYMADHKIQFVSPRPVEFAEATADNVIDIVEGD